MILGPEAVLCSDVNIHDVVDLLYRLNTAHRCATRWFPLLLMPYNGELVNSRSGRPRLAARRKSDIDLVQPAWLPVAGLRLGIVGFV